MVLPDVNVLLGAFRPDASTHPTCRTWLKAVVHGDARFGISPLVLSGVIRISTNRGVYSEPSSLGQAIGFCKDILGQPHCVVINPGDRHWDIFTTLLAEADIKGPRVSDAWFAALAVEHACEWITFDRDFARFPGLRWSRPTNS